MEEKGFSFVLGKDKKPTLFAKGVFGKVYLVTKDGVIYTRKEVRLDGKSERQRKKARQEVEMLASLDHPNILHVEDHWEQEDVVVLMMECATESTLRDSILRQKEERNHTGCGFQEVHILTWAVQICLGLEYMHSQGVLHRDLRSENVFVTSDNVIKLGDFGVSVVLSFAKDAALSVWAEPHWMAPELFANNPYSTKSDMWSFGCLVYEMAALELPFDSEDAKELMRLIWQEDPSPLQEQYTAELGGLITFLLQKHPKERPDAQEVLLLPILRRHLRGFKRRLLEQCAMMKRPQGPSGVTGVDGLGALDEGQPGQDFVRRRSQRRTSRLMMEQGEDGLNRRRSSCTKVDDHLDVEVDPLAAMVSPKVMVNFGTDRQRMKAFLQGPPPEDIDFGADADKLQAFLEGPTFQSVQQGGNRRRSQPRLSQCSFSASDLHYTREFTPMEHQSILGHIVRVYMSPRKETVNSEPSDDDLPPEQMAGSDRLPAFETSKGIPDQAALETQPEEDHDVTDVEDDNQEIPPDSFSVDGLLLLPSVPEVSMEDGLQLAISELEDGVDEGVADDSLGTKGPVFEEACLGAYDPDSDVQCASPHSHPDEDEVEDEAMVDEEDGDDEEDVEEDELCDADSLPTSLPGSSYHIHPP